MAKEGIPVRAESRVSPALEKLVPRCEEVGLPLEHLIVDPLVLTAAAEVAPARLGLEQVIATRDALHRAHRNTGLAVALLAAAWAIVVISLTRRIPGVPAAVLLACLLVLVAGCGRPSRPNVLLLTVDTLRADRVGLYGARIATPNMDRIGREGLVFDAASAPFGRTTQSVGSILTGLHPLRHGADGLGMQLSAGVTTLAERFRGAGWRTAAFASNLFLRPGAGFEQGFEIFSNPRERWAGNSSAALSREALAWLEARRGDDEPWFLWVYYLDPHWVSDPPAAAARQAGAAPAGPDAPSEKVRLIMPPSGRLIFEAPALLPEPDPNCRLPRAPKPPPAPANCVSFNTPKLIPHLEQVNTFLRCVPHGMGGYYACTNSKELLRSMKQQLHVASRSPRRRI